MHIKKNVILIRIQIPMQIQIPIQILDSQTHQNKRGPFDTLSSHKKITRVFSKYRRKDVKSARCSTSLTDMRFI